MSQTPILEILEISKSFPGVQAIRNVSLELQRGQILALLGANGAGKSTLIKLLCGIHRPDSGQVRKDGELVELHSPHDAMNAGIGVIHQEFQLVPTLTARENIFLGTSPPSNRIQAAQERKAASELFARLGVDIDPDRRCSSLSISQQQIVEIAKALNRNAEVLILDEPTAALSPFEAKKLLVLVQELARKGLGIIFITHRLDEVEAIADSITVLRDGQTVFHSKAKDSTRDQWISAMAGRAMSGEFPDRSDKIGEPLLTIRDMNRYPKVNAVSLQLKRGEVVGLTGLVGAGRTELLRLIFGADKASSGSMEMDGKPIVVRSPRDAIKHGICLLTEDRKREGLILLHSIEDNFGLPNLSHFSRWGWMNRKRERARLNDYAQELTIKFPSSRRSVQHLSGGNQQKIVLAKWLETNAQVILFDEPTRGVDVAAKREIYSLIHRLADAGKAVLMVSSEFPEVLGMCHRILVMRAGAIAGELRFEDKPTEEDILRLAVQPNSTDVDYTCAGSSLS